MEGGGIEGVEGSRLGLTTSEQNTPKLTDRKAGDFGSREIDQVLVSFSDFQKFWCSLDRSLQFYESDRSVDPCMQISVKDIICLGISRPDSTNSNGSIDRFVLSPLRFLQLKQLSDCFPHSVLFRFRYTFELYLTSEKLYQFGLETADALHSWTRSIGKVCPCVGTVE